MSGRLTESGWLGILDGLGAFSIVFVTLPAFEELLDFAERVCLNGAVPILTLMAGGRTLIVLGCGPGNSSFSFASASSSSRPFLMDSTRYLA